MEKIFKQDNFFYTSWFFAVCALFVIQYAKLQDVFPVLSTFRPYLLSVLVLISFMFFRATSFLQLGHKQMQYTWLIVFLMGVMIPFVANRAYAFSVFYIMLLYFPFMISVLIAVDTERKLRILVDIMLFVNAFHVIRGIFFAETGRNVLLEDFSGFLKDPNDLSLYLNMMIPFSFFMMLYEKDVVRKIVYGFITLGSILLIVSSFSRGGFVGLVCISFVIWLYSPNKKLTASLAGIFVLLISVWTSHDWIENIQTISNFDDSTVNHRLVMWKASVGIWMNNPIFGVGAGNIPVYMENYIDYATRSYWMVNHSLWLTWLAEMGLVGFLLFITIVLYNMRDSLFMGRIKPFDEDSRFMKYFGVASFASLIGFLSSGTFLTVNYYPHFWYLTALIMVGSKIVSIKSKVGI